MPTEKEQLKELAVKAVRDYVAKCGPDEAFCVPLDEERLLLVGHPGPCVTLIRMWLGV